MVSKIFLCVAIVSSVGFLVISMRVGNQVEGALQSVGEDSAVQMSSMVRSSIEQAMLSGNGIKVKNLVEDLKKSVAASETEIHIYDPQGIEVFAPKQVAPDPSSLDRHVAMVLKSQERQVLDDRVVRSIPMEKRCARSGCHAASDRQRGVLSMKVAPDVCREKRNRVLREIVTSGFLHLMTARRSEHLDEFFEDIRVSTPSIRGIAVYDAEGDPSFGLDMEEFGVESEQVLAVMAAGDSQRLAIPNGTIEVVTLKKQERCVECHQYGAEVRGALLVALADPISVQECDAAELETLIDTSLRHIMTSELGRIIAQFLDSIVATGGVEELVLYDKEGRVYWNTTHPAPPAHISIAIAKEQTVIDHVGEGENQRVRVVAPLRNSARCARCHGSAMALRGLVEVSASTRMAASTKSESKNIIMLTTAMAVLSMLFVLIFILQFVVVRPVREISGVADAIGDGQLDVQVAHADAKGDEVARLGARINAMIQDLRTKFHLEKFVSKSTAQAARSGGVETTSEGGERREATILFSDIRGFTAYSEQVSAEEVVRMLNRILKAQTDVVHEHGGDVDKFVGDELMAIFEGEDANIRATSCSLAMLDAIHLVRETDLEVGIGIATGEVVIGAIGHEDRLDFTAIGDVVNTGARLCSAAKGNEVIVTKAVRDAAAGASECEFEPREALAVKGKQEPLQVFHVRKKPA
jgi:adenylate cyclase